MADKLSNNNKNDSQEKENNLQEEPQIQLASSIHGVRYAVVKNQFRFAATDIASKFGYSSPITALKNCSQIFTDVNISGCKKTIDLTGVIELGKNAPVIPGEFVDALQEMVHNYDPKKVAEQQKATGQQKATEQENHTTETKTTKANNIDDNNIPSTKIPADMFSNLDPEEKPDFNDPAEAARAWAKQYEMRKEAEKKVLELKEVLGDGQYYKISHNIPWLYDIFNKNNKYLLSIVGGALTRMSRNMHVPVETCRAFGYSFTQTKRMYRVDVIEAMRQRLLDDDKWLAKHRRRHFVKII